MTIRRAVSAAVLLVSPVLLAGQTAAPQETGGVDPASLRRPLAESWPSYSGDYTGRRFSALTQVNRRTGQERSRWRGSAGSQQVPARPVDGLPVRRLSSSAGMGPKTRASAGPRRQGINSSSRRRAVCDTRRINVWAMDARDGREFWQYSGKRAAGRTSAIAARRSGRTICSSRRRTTTSSRSTREPARSAGTSRLPTSEQYFSTPAPIIVDNHVLVGTGNDLDVPGFLQSFDPETGKLQWKFYTVPMNPGDPGLETWPSLDAARHGGGQVWVPGVYDPETRLYIFGTGNPTPAYTGVARRGDNLFTCSLVAVNVDTGKMAWYFQTSPHDTHDWDSAQTPILIDGDDQRQAAQARVDGARNGYFFTLDRVTGQHIVTPQVRHGDQLGQAASAYGVVEPNPGKEATIPGALVSPVEGGVTNWPPPAFSPNTGLFYAHEKNGFNIVYLTDPDPRGSMGLGGKTVANVGSAPELSDGHRLPDRQAPGGMLPEHERRRAAPAACWRRPVTCCSRATPTATSSPSMRPTASRCGTRGSATSRTRPRPHGRRPAVRARRPSAIRSTRS